MPCVFCDIAQCEALSHAVVFVQPKMAGPPRKLPVNRRAHQSKGTTGLRDAPPHQRGIRKPSQGVYPDLRRASSLIYVRVLRYLDELSIAEVSLSIIEVSSGEIFRPHSRHS
jgi:hypothetical protein